MATVAELLRAVDGLPGDSPHRDLEILLGHCLQRSRTWLFTWPETELAEDQLQRFNSLLDRRRGGEPIAHITGRREFWSLNLEVDASTLIPRPDTETLVEWALELPLPDRARVIDLGTGTGAIALALASERPGWQLLATDASGDAVALARRNARACELSRVEVLQSDWFSAVAGREFDLIVSNPPYIPERDPHLAQGDVRFEPRTALVAAADGLADLAQICSAAPAHLAAGGWLLLEHGHDQAGAVRELLQGAGFARIETRRDMGGNERITGGRIDAE